MAKKKTRQEWLLIRQDTAQITYVLSNASESIDLKTMAWRKAHRYLIEHSNQDAKDEFGWDEFQTRKYRAWKHQLALLFWLPGLLRKHALTGKNALNKVRICSLNTKWMYKCA